MRENTLLRQTRRRVTTVNGGTASSASLVATKEMAHKKQAKKAAKRAIIFIYGTIAWFWFARALSYHIESN